MTIARVNNVDIMMSTSDEQLVPIRPICDALGISDEVQWRKINDDGDLTSVATLREATGKDGKTYQMRCLPMKFIFGWLFTINPKNVKPEAQDAVRQFRMECYNALYRHFTARYDFVVRKQKEIDAQLVVVENAKSNFKNAKNVMAEAEEKLKKLRCLTLADYDFESRQLRLDF